MEENKVETQEVAIDAVADETPQGAFFDSLIRSNSKIKKDRAAEIHESAEVLYKRTIEDMKLKVKQLGRDRRSMMDLSPNSAISLQLASDFDAATFVDKDLQIGVALRELEIKLDIAEKRYSYLFGKEV